MEDLEKTQDLTYQCMLCKRIKHGETWVVVPHWERKLEGKRVSHIICRPCFVDKYGGADEEDE